MPKFTPKQIAALNAINTIPAGQAFRGKDLVAAGYPGKDAAAVLQSATVFGTFVNYHPDYDFRGPILYVKSDLFDVYFPFWMERQKNYC